MRILVVEDEVRLATLLRRGLSEEGHAVDLAADGEEALAWIDVGDYDAIILDIMLPGIDGLEVCRSLRRRRVQIPILLLTARDSVADRVAGLDVGADDYLVKPFAFAELTARLRALARRPPETHDPVLAAGEVRLDPASRRVWRGADEIQLPNKEFRILEYLMRHPNRVLTRAMIAEHVWDYDFPNVTNVIDVHIRQLRRLLHDPYPGGLIDTVRGAGYRLSRGVGSWESGVRRRDESEVGGRRSEDGAMPGSVTEPVPAATTSHHQTPDLRLPIRWRLTLWYAALLATAMVLFSGALYLVMRQQLYASLDEQLLNQAALTLAAVRIEEGNPTIESATAGVADGEYFLRLFDRKDRIVLETGGHPDGVPVDGDVVAAALAGQTRYSAALDEDGETIRIVSVPVRPDGMQGSAAGVLQIGLDRNEIDEPLAGLLSALALAGPVVLLLAAVSGYLLAGRALAPVATITSLVARIGARDLGARLRLDLPDDELGRLARTFDAMLARIDDAFERQRRFTGDAAHELRTPLTLMRSQVDLALARPRTAEEYREALRGLDGDLQRMTGLVSTLLTLARADAGRLIPERAPFDLAATIALILEQYAPLATEAGVTLRSETAPTPLVADEDLLVQLLVNLFDNALAHTPCGGVVTVGCRPESDRARLWVTDTGEGIAPEHAGRVFDRFFRVDAGRTRARGGTGLGLAICKAIAEAHGGSISLTSTPSRGTRVAASIPAGH